MPFKPERTPPTFDSAMRDTDYKRAAIRDAENALNSALLVWGFDNLELRQVLLKARGDIREALGEGRT